VEMLRRRPCDGIPLAMTMPAWCGGLNC
jgi:hypothetical protein